MRFLVFSILVSVSLSAFSQARYDTLPNLPQHYADRLAKFKKEQVVTGKIVFVGNSITEGGNWRKLLKDSSVINRGISGDNTFGVLQRIDEITRHKPSSIFLLIGINDLSKNIPNERIIENIFSIISKIRAGSPGTKIFVQSLLPVNPSVKGFFTQFNKHTKILEVNSQLKRFSEVLKYKYVDIHESFIDKGGVLDAKFTKDGLHLNQAGYIHWVEFLKKGAYL
ncbi:SGNH/GDSL hydrolase family protein [soil metagenome]